MPGSRTTLPHTALTLLLTAPLSCSPADEPGQVSDPQGCRTVILPADSEATSTSTSSSSSASSSTASTTYPLPVCGNGTVEAPEECDDGFEHNGPSQTCNADCMNNVCGDGDQGPSEECDDGNGIETDACLSTCVAASCGDGYVWNGEEACDDGNTEDLDACSIDCQTARRFVFVTSDVVTGNLAGLAGADALCNSLVDNARADMVPEFLTGRTYKAWLSDDTQTPATRFSAAEDPSFSGTYVLVDATREPVELVPVAVGWNGLISGTLAHPPDHDQYGKLITSQNKEIWSNTQPDGTGGKWAMAPNQLDDAHCMKWSSTVGFGNTGAADLKNGNWTARTASSCDNPARLYCIEDP